MEAREGFHAGLARPMIAEIEPSDQSVELANMGLDAGDQERVHGGEHEVDVRFFAATHTGAITTHGGLVVVLLEEQRGEDADPLLEVGDVDIAVVGFREPLP